MKHVNRDKSTFCFYENLKQWQEFFKSWIKLKSIETTSLNNWMLFLSFSNVNLREWGRRLTLWESGSATFWKMVKVTYLSSTYLSERYLAYLDLLTFWKVFPNAFLARDGPRVEPIASPFNYLYIKMSYQTMEFPFHCLKQWSFHCLGRF